MMSGLNRCPVTFTVNKEFNSKDTRFIDVSIDVMHTGDNLNFTSFTKEVIEAALPTIKNIPILGYIECNKDGDLDFKGHEHEIVIDDDGIKYVYSGSAYGVVPESCNPRWVTKDDGTGVMRDYIRVDGVLWTKFDDSVEIFERDIKKNHSVELLQMEGSVDERGYYNVSSFCFDGCCILSTTDATIRPAMTGSNIVAEFDVKTVASQIKDKLCEYEQIKSKDGFVAFNEGDKKGDDKMDEKLAVLKEFDISEDSLDFSLEDISIEELREKCEEMAKKKGGCKTKCTASSYALDAVQKLEEARSVLEKEKFTDQWGDECCRYWMMEMTDTDLIVQDGMDWKVYGIPYKMDGDNIVVDYKCKRRMKCTYVDWEEGTAPSDEPIPTFELMKKHMDKAENSINELKVFKDKYEEIQPKYDAYVAAEKAAAEQKDKENREKLFSVMDEQLGDSEEYSKLKENKEMSFADLSKECYALVGKKRMEFSYKPSVAANNNTVRFGVDGVQNGHSTDSKYGDLFERYGK